MEKRRELLNKLKTRILHNWYLKLFSIVLAVILWAVAYNIENPVTSTRFANVEVTFVNTEVLEENDQVYTVLNNSNVVRTVTVSASRTIIDDITSDDIVVEADFSKMRLDGTVDLTFTCTKYDNSNVTFSASSTTLELDVEDKLERYFRLTAEVTGTTEDGYIVSGSTLEQNQISVSGPESIVSGISSAKASVVLDDATENVVTYADIVLYDSDGNEISQDRLTLGSSRVRVTVEVLKTKTVPIVYEIDVTPAAGYLLSGDLITEADTITLAGKSGVVDTVTELVVSGDEYIVTDATADVVFEIDLDDYLSTSIVRADQDDNGVVTVTQPVEAVYSTEVSIGTDQITIAGVPDGYGAQISDAELTVAVVVEGLEETVQTVRSSDITGVIDIEAWMEDEGLTRLVDGREYEIPVTYSVSVDGLNIASGDSVTVLIWEIAEEEE
ncbi:MAG: hypothetical protein LUG61_10575 [Lachnospiraceae bacterium]|nr:hypothetical protein [Lachnospiraceae bacterium]